MLQSIQELRAYMEQFAKALNSLAEGVALVARDEVAELLSRYNDLVPVCDQRLERCSGLLEKGLRNEALGYEADEPALLESVTLLDLSSRPQWPRWLDVLKALGFPEPVMPKVEIAVELRDAQEQVARLKPLLDQWRRANLANAPLPARIATLRQLRRQDPNNEAWHECLKAHEKQRAMEIEADVKSAVAARDEQRLAALAEEFKSQWLEAAPQRVVKAVETALASIRGGRIDAEIKQVAAGLAAALDAKDLDAGRAFRDRWNPLVAAKGAFNADDADVLRALPAVEWVERHDRLDALFDAVSQGLDARPPQRDGRREWVRSLARMRDEVEDLAEKLHDEIDLEPIERLRARVARVSDEVQRDETSRRRLMYLAVVATASVLVGSVIMVASLMRRADQVRQAIAALQKRQAEMDKGAVDPSVSFDFGFPDWLEREPPVATALAALDQATKSEAQRRGDLTAAAAEVKGMIDTLSARPAAQTLDPWPDPFVAATKAWAAIKEKQLTKTAEDAGMVDAMEKRLTNAANRFQRDADEVLSGRVADIEARLARLRGDMRGSGGKAGEDLAGIVKDVRDLRLIASEPGAPGAAPPFAEQRRVSGAAGKPLDPDQDLERTIATVRAEMSDRQRFEEAERGLDEALGDWKRYGDKLESLAREFGKQVAAKDYAEAAKEAPLWVALGEWNRFAETMRPLAELSADDARVMVERFDQMRERAEKLAIVSEFNDAYLGALRKFAERQPPQLAAALREWCEREWLGELAWTVTFEGNTFYSRFKPDGKGYSFKFQRNIKLTQDAEWPSQASWEKDDEQELVVEPSPQKLLADQLMSQFVSKIAEQAPGVALDEVLCDMTTKLVGDVKVEPCLRIVSLRKFLVLGRDNSLAFETPAVGGLFRKLEDESGPFPGLKIEEIGEFLDPEREENQAYQKVKKTAERILADAGTVLSKVQADILALRRKLVNAKATAYACVGRVSRDVEGQFVVAPQKNVTWVKGADAFVIRPDGSLDVVGTCGDPGRISITATRPLVAGMPVFTAKSKPRVAGGPADVP
jgi:hypothetical protein